MKMQSVDKYNEYRDLLAQMMLNDNTVHFLWLCNENKTLSFGKPFLPENVSDPFDYIGENKFVCDESQDAFNVFVAQIMDGIINGLERNDISIDLVMKFSEDEPKKLCHLFALFLRDEKNCINAVHVNIRQFTARQVFNRQVLSVFTSDKAPQLFGKRCQALLDNHPNDKVAFIQFDIERFKLINERYGVEFGDELLKFIIDSLGTICGGEMPYSRLSADLFMVVTPFETEEGLLKFVRKLESMLLGYKGAEYRLIFGIAIAEDRTLHTRRHGDNAGIARREIHGNALDNVSWYNGSMKSALCKTQSIESDMQGALLDNEFVMFLQPKHCISTGRIIGAEALARWIHHEKGMISPADFIPVFERNGFILKLDQFIWESACRQIRDWIDRGIEVVPISVNISREYISRFDVVDFLSNLVKKYDIPINLLELEITESVDASGVDEVVTNLKKAGFKMLMDDFGAGYSSLNMLKTTQFDVLKIDRAFLNEFMNSERGRKIISHTISMSQDIGLDIIAEGVETFEQANFLKDCGCDAAQGFYYSKPVPIADFEKRLLEINV